MVKIEPTRRLGPLKLYDVSDFRIGEEIELYLRGKRKYTLMRGGKVLDKFILKGAYGRKIPHIRILLCETGKIEENIKDGRKKVVDRREIEPRSIMYSLDKIIEAHSLDR